MPLPEPTGVDVEALRRLLVEATAPDNPCFKYMDYSGPGECEVLGALLDAYPALLSSAERASRLEAALRALMPRLDQLATLDEEDSRSSEPDDRAFHAGRAKGLRMAMGYLDRFTRALTTPETLK